MRVFSVVAAVALLAGAITTPAHASTCLLQVDGKRWIDGACSTHRLGTGFKFAEDKVASRAHIGVLWVDSINSSAGSAAWGGPGRTGDNARGNEVPLGVVKRDGISCWKNAHVRLCLWGVNDSGDE